MQSLPRLPAPPGAELDLRAATARAVALISHSSLDLRTSVLTFQRSQAHKASVARFQTEARSQAEDPSLAEARFQASIACQECSRATATILVVRAKPAYAQLGCPVTRLPDLATSANHLVAHKEASNRCRHLASVMALPAFATSVA